MRIQKYLSEQGVASRREAEKLIKAGLVKLNGVVVREMGVQMDPAKDKITVSPVRPGATAKTTIALNKPRGIACSTVQTEGKTVHDAYPQFKHLNIVGRLDKASEGLLLLSDDGLVTKAVTGDKHLVEKEYQVVVREDVNAGRLKSLEPGIVLEDGPTLPCTTKFLNKHAFLITLREGRKHQISRMCEYLHLTVVRLLRVRIGPIDLDHMKSGTFRTLTAAEIQRLKHR